ncbi:transcriptional regulator [Leptolyngbya sp. Heron Island J]|uniref:ArsR/SmtB family transcription factor n=1 Tax=Leptolyngbya sp. Heron Island J TaxID=1385935 RepID=UPI0003B96E3A|nr:metalloregulator ArsR/SmtB family transcription factor [Leptolyngbya sp. Heron Island J]ESA34945.1 transcriptional regulator [Leptolyngbya sp. Heron Island J]
MTQEPVISGFHALSDPIRIQILELLQNEELCVSDMCQKLGIAQSRISFHLKALKIAALVSVRQQGRWMYYSLNKEQFGHLEAYLSGY